MKTEEIKELYEQYILPTYSKMPVCLVKGKGSRVWDAEGRDYIDFFPGWGVSGLGHCHPEIVNAVKDQLRKMIHVSNNFYNIKQAKLAEELVRAAFPSRVFFCNSGAEASEAAVKFTRKYGKDKGRYEIISMRQSFHGRTLAGIAVTGQEKVQRGFEPLPMGFCYAVLNDLDSVKAAITPRTAGIFLEPIQGEGGIHVATPEFMSGLRKICDENDLLLILDEVQTGMGRTGKMFAYQHYGMEPDLMTLAKALGSGVPIGALVVNLRVKKNVFEPGTHGSTYGGNPLVAAAGLATLRVIRKEGLVRRAQELGDYLGARLEELKNKYPLLIESVRGMALMRALQLKVSGALLVEKARKAGLLINCTQDTVLRIMPALTIPKKILDRGLNLLDQSFAEEAGERGGSCCSCCIQQGDCRNG
jgi:predicted acetylornithine/succinylornithine family transaminase